MAVNRGGTAIIRPLAVWQGRFYFVFKAKEIEYEDL